MQLTQEFIKIDSVKEGIVDYINNLIIMYMPYMSGRPKIIGKDPLKSEFKRLRALVKTTQDCNDINGFYTIKQAVENVESSIELRIRKERIDALSSREVALVNRGYDVDDVIRLSYFTESQAQIIANNIFNRITKNCERVKYPVCYFLGGQPGCGKSTASMQLKAKYGNGGIVDVGIDNYRTYHPNYLEIEKCIKKYWEGKQPDDNSSPGNDIADFTHAFAGRISDILADKLIAKVDGKSYNIVMEWGMRTPTEPIKRMKEFKSLGYRNYVDFIAVHEDISYEACKLRADIMNDHNHIVRRVPKSFHDLAVSTLPESSSIIYEETMVKDNAVEDFLITSRVGDILWNNKMSDSPKDTYFNVLHNPELSVGMINHEDIARLSYLTEALGFSSEEVEKTNSK